MSNNKIQRIMTDRYSHILNAFFSSPMWLQARVFSDGEAFLDLVHATDGGVRLVTSVRRLAARWGWHTKHTRLFLRRLANIRLIHLDSRRDKSVITIDDDCDVSRMAAYNVNRGTAEGTVNKLNTNALHAAGAQPGAQGGTAWGTANVLDNNDLRLSGAQPGAQQAIYKGTAWGTANTLNDSDLRLSGAQPGAQQASTIDSSIYSNEYILIKDKSLINPLYTHEDEENVSTEDEKEVETTCRGRDRDGEQDEATCRERVRLPKEESPLSAADYSSLADHYNAAAARGNLPPLRMLTPKRKGALRARCRDYGIDTLYTAIDMAAASPFLTGDNKRGWRANFDWIFRPNNFLKIIEGHYEKTIKKDNAAVYRRPSREEDKLRRDQEFAQHLYNKLNGLEPEPVLADI